MAISGVGLIALACVLLYRGWPPGIAMLEVTVIGGLFFGGTLCVSLRRLIRREHPNG